MHFLFSDTNKVPGEIVANIFGMKTNPFGARLTSVTRHFTSDNKLRSKMSRMSFFTWNYSSDGRASPAHAGDDDEAEAFVLQPGDAHVVGVALSVTLWGESRLEIGLEHVGIVDSPRDIFSARPNSGGRVSCGACLAKQWEGR